MARHQVRDAFARSLGERLFTLLLEALPPPDDPLPSRRIDLRIGPPEHALTLRCDASPSDAPVDRTRRLIRYSRSGDGASGLLAEFLDALAHGPAHGMLFCAVTTPRAVFRGVLAGCQVRLAIAEQRGAISRWHGRRVGASMRRGTQPWRPSW